MTFDRKVYMKSYNQRPEIKARQNAYKQKPEYKTHQKAYHQRPEVKAHIKAYHQRPEVKAHIKAYHQRPEVKARMKAYNQRPEVKDRQRAYDKAYYQKHKECAPRFFKKLLERKKLASPDSLFSASNRVLRILAYDGIALDKELKRRRIISDQDTGGMGGRR